MPAVQETPGLRFIQTQRDVGLGCHSLLVVNANSQQAVDLVSKQLIGVKFPIREFNCSNGKGNLREQTESITLWNNAHLS